MKKTIAIITIIGAVFTGLTIIYHHFFPSPEEVEKISRDQTDMGIDVYSNRERTLMQQELDVIQNLERQESLTPSERSNDLLKALRENKEILKLERERVKKKREYYEERKLR